MEKQPTPSVIVCGVTGSEASLNAASHAARMAKERNAQLVYVFAIDLRFLDGMAIELSGHVAAEALRQVGATILERAASVAHAYAVTPKNVLREGPVLQVLKDVVREERATVLVIGRDPHSFFEKVVFKRDWVEDHIQELKAETGVDVVVV